MKNAKEYLITEVSSDTDITKLTPNQISNIMESYAMYFHLHQSKLKNNGGLGDVSNNENDSEVAFCDSPIHDFDRCPLIKQTNNCKNCRYYN